MKRFHFRLESLLRLRRQKARLAEARQRHAHRVWAAAQSEVAFLHDRLVQGASAVEARIGQTIETDFWVAQFQHMTQLRLAVDAAEANAKRAMTAFEEANRLRRIAATEYEALRHLREQQWQTHRQESAQAEQQRLDDVYLHRDRFSRLSSTTNPIPTGVFQTMKKTFHLLIVALMMFGTAAGASWTLQKMKATEEPAGSTDHATRKSPAHAAEPPESTEAQPARVVPTDETPVRVAVLPTYAPGVEETVRLASSLRDRAALVREREDQLAARHRQLELVIENIRSERSAIDELRNDLEAAIKGAEAHMTEVQRQRTELEIKQQNIDGRVTEMSGHEKDNLKKMASVYDNMAAESAAKIIQHMADSGTMDTAVKLLAMMKERQAAKVLAEMPDPSLAAQLSERLKDLKHPPARAKE